MVSAFDALIDLRGGMKVVSLQRGSEFTLPMFAPVFWSLFANLTPWQKGWVQAWFDPTYSGFDRYSIVYKALLG